MLLPDEKVIMYWLSQYGVMIQEQALLLLYDKPRPTAQKIIRGLIKNNRICYINGGYYIGASPLCKPDEKTITAIWVLLRYIGKIGICDHHSANYPGQIYFLKDQTGYEIIVLNEGEYMLPSLLTPQEQLKYIIVVPREDDIPHVRILFANLEEQTLDGSCVSDAFMEHLEAVPEGTMMELLVHPHCGYIVEMKTEDQIILDFADASNRLWREAIGFLVLGVFLYGTVVYLSVAAIRKKL